MRVDIWIEEDLFALGLVLISVSALCCGFEIILSLVFGPNKRKTIFEWEKDFVTTELLRYILSTDNPLRILLQNLG